MRGESNICEPLAPFTPASHLLVLVLVLVFVLVLLLVLILVLVLGLGLVLILILKLVLVLAGTSTVVEQLLQVVLVLVLEIVLHCNRPFNKRDAGAPNGLLASRLSGMLGPES